MNLKTSSSNKKNHEKSYACILIASAILFSLLMAGCSYSHRPTVLNVYTGTEGVEIEFTSGNPPDEIYEGSDVILMAEIWNKGAFTPSKANEDEPILISINVDDVYLDVLGDTGLVESSTDGVLTMYLEGKSEAWPTGESTIIPIAQLKANTIPGTRESPVTTIEASVCYKYKTYFSENICVDTDIYNIDTDPICENQKTYTYSGQGAPVIISKVEVDMVPVGITSDAVSISVPVVNGSGELQTITDGTSQGKSIIVEPYFRIYFTNVGGGVVLSAKDDTNPCVKGPSADGKALIIEAYLNNVKLNCSDAEIKLYSSEGSVRCWLPEEEAKKFELNRNFEAPLKLEAEYFYRTTTAKEVNIVRTS